MAERTMSDVVERFLRYCEIESQSDPLNAKTVPSTPSQFTIANAVAQDLEAIGAEDVRVDGHAYVTAFVPASPGAEDLPTLGFIAHIDTAWQANGGPVHPRIVDYRGGNLVAGEVEGRIVQTTPQEFPELDQLIGQQLVVTDGTSLLGADDKAGIAEIVSMAARLVENPSIPHPRIAIAFVPDEEIGHGAELLDLEAWGASWGYTVDGGPLGEINYETFNAAEAHVYARGVAVHTGYAKGLLVNAMEAIHRFHDMLPPQERPEYTEDREGFFFLERVTGDCEIAQADYLIRDHDAVKFAHRKALMEQAVALVNSEYDEEILSIEIKDQYSNMRLGIEAHPHLIENARFAYEDCGVRPFAVAVRGGTDGAQLTLRGLPCPNLSSGSRNPHGPREFVPIRDLEVMVDVLQALATRYAQPVREAGDVKACRVA